MRYILCAIVGVAGAVISIALITSGVYALALMGSCASGGPFEIANQCDPGTGAEAFKLTAGIFGLMVSVVVFAVRGTPGGAGPGGPGGALQSAGGSIGLAGAAWSMMWIGLAAAVWFSERNVATDDTASTVALTLTIVFGALGVLSLIGVLLPILIGRKPRPAVAIGNAGAAGGLAVAGNLADLVRQAQEIARQQKAGGISAGDVDEFGDPPRRG